MRAIVGLALTASLCLTACGGGSGSGGGSQSDATPSPTPPSVPTAAPTAAPVVSLTFHHTYAEILPQGAKAAGLEQGMDGNYYGVDVYAGNKSCASNDPINCGTIFRVTPDGVRSEVYAFGAIPNDGYRPGVLITGNYGALYGTTTNGGAFGGGGTLFRLTLDGAYTILYSFGASPDDGLVPLSLMQASDGNFYGITASGGANHCDAVPQAGTNCGTVFKATPAGEVTILHSFGSGSDDGFLPQGILVEGADGQLYGVTQTGGVNSCSGPNSCGTLFRISTGGALTILHSFGDGQGDGIAPVQVLLSAPDGTIYGATSSGGGYRCGWSFGCGTIYAYAPDGSFRIVYRFAEENVLNGVGPWSLLMGRDGYLYGTTNSGGQHQCSSCGSVFRLTTGGVLTTLYSFGPVNQTPTRPAMLSEGSDGAFYGWTEWPNTHDGSFSAFRMTVN